MFFQFIKYRFATLKYTFGLFLIWMSEVCTWFLMHHKTKISTGVPEIWHWIYFMMSGDQFDELLKMFLPTGTFLFFFKKIKNKCSHLSSSWSSFIYTEVTSFEPLMAAKKEENPVFQKYLWQRTASGPECKHQGLDLRIYLMSLFKLE